MSARLSFAISGTAWVLLAFPAAAQVGPPPARLAPTLSLEAVKPTPDSEFERWSAATAALFLAARVPIAGNVALVADLPFAHAVSRYSDVSATSNAIGNPYVGIQATPGAGAFSYDLGVRLPVATTSGDDDFALGVGILADMTRMEAFLPDVASASGGIAFQHRDANGLMLGLRAGSTLWVYTGDTPDVDPELFADYRARLGYATGAVDVGASLTGRAILTEETRPGGDRAFHFAALDAGVNVGRLRPEIYAALPIESNVGDIVKHIVGVRLTVRLH
jgi:hypothetical protein